MGALIWAQLALAASTTVVIDVRDESGASWRAEALEVIAADALGEDSWHWRGELAADKLHYEVRRSAESAVVALGVIDLSALDRTGFETAVRATIFGLSQKTEDHETVAAPARGPPSAAILLLLIVGAILLALPLLLFVRSIASAPLRAIRERRSLRWLFAVWIVCGLVGVAITSTDVAIARPWLIFGCGGLAWSVFFAATTRSIFPAFSGLGRVEHRDVFRLLGDWMWVALLRVVRSAVFYSPFFAILWLVVSIEPVEPAFLVMVVVPLWGLVARFCYLAVVENAALRLDKIFVVGPADAGNPWHDAVRGYYLGYVRRLGWDEGIAIANDVLFLPGHGQALAVYGGGLCEPRIVIGKDLLEFGLAPYGRPHDYEAPREDKLFWSDWHAGLIVPTTSDTAIAPRELRRVEHIAEPGDEEGLVQLGQPPTLAGFVEPSALDKRLTHRPAEDPTWLEWDPTTEHDGTDPGDHDFLFGAVVHKLGAIQRHADRRQTIALTLASLAPRVPSPARRAARLLAAPYRGLFERPQIELADAFAAVNFASHHLLQLLAWQTWRDDALLTSRALAPELKRQSERIYQLLRADKQRSKRPNATRTRMRFLGLLVADDDERRLRRDARLFGLRSRLPLLAALAALASLLAFNVYRAIDYHPRYLEKQQTAPTAQGPTSQ